MATIDHLEDWLIKIAEHTRMTREALEGRAAGAGAPRASPEALLDRVGRRVEQAVAQGLAARVSQAQGLAQRGFGGTVEQARFDYAMDQLSKQFAAVMRPILDGMTYAAVQIERRMRAMGGAEQNRLMGGIVGAGLGFGLLGGARGGVGGALLGMGVLGDSPTLGAAGGALLGSRLGPVGAVVGGIGGAIASARYGDLYEMYKRDVARDLGGSSVLSRGIAGLSAAGASVFDAVTGGSATESLVARGRLAPRGGTPEPPRAVTPFQAQMGDAGSTYFRMQEAMIRTTAGADFEDGGPFKPVIDVGLAILDQLIRMGGGTPPPRSGTDVRG